MKIKFVGAVERNESGEWLFPRLVRKRGEPSHVTIPSGDSTFIEQAEREPLILNNKTGLVLYRRCLVEVRAPLVPIEEVLLAVKHNILSRERAFQRMKREVEAFENFEKLSTAPREPISAEIRMFVWQRDGGKCVRCGCSERLEFDHIIPVSKGGSSTERNIQLLCETCNRAKGIEI